MKSSTARSLQLRVRSSKQKNAKISAYDYVAPSSPHVEGSIHGNRYSSACNPTNQSQIVVTTNTIRVDSAIQQSFNFTFTPASMSSIYYHSSPRRGGSFPNPQSTHRTNTSGSSPLLVHQHARSCPLCGPSSHRNCSYPMSVLPTRPQLFSAWHLYPLTRKFPLPVFPFHLLIFMLENLRLIPHWCS